MVELEPQRIITSVAAVRLALLISPGGLEVSANDLPTNCDAVPKKKRGPYHGFKMVEILERSEPVAPLGYW